MGLRLEHGTAISDFLAAGLAAAWRIEHVVRDESSLLRRLIYLEQEHPIEEVQELVQVQRDAAQEHRSVLLSQQLLHSRSAPNPAM